MPLPETTKDILAGTAGGIAQVLVGQPFDIVKVRVQTAPPGYFKGAYTQLTSGVGDCIAHIVKDEGAMAFYKGTTMPLIGVGACVSIQFGVVQYFKRLFGDENAKRGRQDLSHVQLYTSGLAGGIANSVLAGPIEHVRIRMQTQKGNELRGPFDALRQIAARGGVSSVFRGMGPTVLREGHGMGIYFLTYEYLVQKKLQADKISREQLPNTTSMLAGAAAGTVVRALRSPQLWLMVYPIDVVKSYLQTDAIDPAKRRFRGSLDVVRHIYETGGLRGFVRGIEPTLIRAPFANGATFVAFEAAMRYLSAM